jgi:hypothetical protein
LWIKVITKLPNSEQSYKGKVQTVIITVGNVRMTEKSPCIGFPWTKDWVCYGKIGLAGRTGSQPATELRTILQRESPNS